MMKTKIALGALLMAAVALVPASAAQQKKAKTSAKTQNQSKSAAKKQSKAVAAPVAASNEKRQDRSMDLRSGQFLNALWKIDPETAIAVGKYDNAALLTIPNQAYRNQQLAFIKDWQERFAKINPDQLSDKQRTDLELLNNKLASDRWYLNTFREFEWNPALYNVASPIDLVLHTDYASEPQRLRTLLRRIANVPAYYEAARANIKNPTREHTQLAVMQGAGTHTVLNDLGKVAQASTILTAAEKKLYASRITAAHLAVDAYIVWLSRLDQKMEAEGGARSFRIGKELYDQKFAYDVQASVNAGQMYQKALDERERLLTHMNTLSDELWAKTMGDTAKPADRSAKIGMVIDKLSANHVARADFFPEIRRQIPLLQQWVIDKDLLTIDKSKPLEVRETPAYQRGVARASIDAPGPYRPQDRTFYNVSPLDDMTPEQAESSLREYNHWILQILNIHEAIPGHYTQLVYANRSPSIIKSIFGNGAMVEGWANYGERMMMESGYGGNTPEMWLMYSKWNLRSVSNTILDYSVHVNGMTREQAIEMLTKQAFQTQSEAEGKWTRVQLSSVQLTSYYSGYSEIVDLREERKQALGERFNLKKFNEEFLSFGNAPVKVIKQLMTK